MGQGDPIRKIMKIPADGTRSPVKPLELGSNCFLEPLIEFPKCFSVQGLIQKGNKIEFYLVHLSYLLVFNIIFAYIKCTVFNYP